MPAIVSKKTNLLRLLNSKPAQFAVMAVFLLGFAWIGKEVFFSKAATATVYNGKIVYCNGAAKVMNPDGGNTATLFSNSSVNALDCVWSPDGTKIAFISSTYTNNQWYQQVYVINSDGSGLKQITKSAVKGHDYYSLAWHSSQQSLVFCGTIGNDTYPKYLKVDMLGNVSALTAPSDFYCDDYTTTYSTKTGKIAYVRDNKIKLGDGGTGSTVLVDLTGTAKPYVKHLIFNRLGTKLAYNSDSQGSTGTGWGITTVSTSGGSTKQVVKPSVVTGFFSFSPDSKLLAYQSSGTNSYVVSASGGTPQKINLVYGIDPGGWQPVFDHPVTSRVTVFRLSNPSNGSFLYTVSTAERDNATNNGWHLDGPAFYAYPQDTTGVDGIADVYRLSRNGMFLFTTSSSERDNAANSGWHYDGPAFRAFTGSAATSYVGGTLTTVYRLYNASTGSFLYTANTTERDNAANSGWQVNGPAFYAFTTQYN